MIPSRRKWEEKVQVGAENLKNKKEEEEEGVEKRRRRKAKRWKGWSRREASRVLNIGMSSPLLDTHILSFLGHRSPSMPVSCSDQHLFTVSTL